MEEKFNLIFLSLVLLNVAVDLECKVMHLSKDSNENNVIKMDIPDPLKSNDGDTSSGDKSCDISDNDRFDCFSDRGATQAKCEARGCCWKPASSNGIPYCFYPTDNEGYKVDSETLTEWGMTAKLSRSSKSHWPEDVMQLQLDVKYETASRLHFKIFDPNHARYEVPIETPQVNNKAHTTDYAVTISKQPFAITVTRKSTNQPVFDTKLNTPFIFANQYIEISTSLANKFVYGLGEHRSSFQLNTTWQTLAFWARDQPPTPNVNLYGDHPFFMSFDDIGNAYGVFLLNSNAMDISLQPKPAATYRTIGGILDFYIFLGPTPDDVIKQYQGTIGYPFMPPYWSLGFHLCRYGYKSSDDIRTVINRMQAGKFPYDAQWCDIDYMKDHLDWTYDADKFKDLPTIVKDLHDNGMHYVNIIDPGISSTQPKGSYKPYDDGLRQGVFVMKADGSGPIIGKVWPGNTAYPDFTNPTTIDYWYQSASDFHNQVPFDGLWTDMNEPSNFDVGSTEGCSTNPLDDPPFTPGIAGGRLADKTLCASSKHHTTTHYNVHSLYGHGEAIASNLALKKIRNKRPLVITRSSFPSTGRHAGHWLGDNNSGWNDLYYSIPGILNFNMFGIPLVGPDTCGFGGTTTEELCTRWMELAAFYPFMRNHNTIGAKDQDPAVFSPAAQDTMRDALMMRYNLLPHLYTLFYRAHINGSMVVRPLSFQYPKDKATYAIDKQFLWSNTLMISPVLEQGKTSVSAYLPRDTWFDYHSGVAVTGTGSWVTLNAPLNYINVHVRGGSIIPRQQADVTTTAARKNPFNLLVVLSANGKATGELYWDDGDTIDTTEHGVYNLIQFTAYNNTLQSRVQLANFHTSMVLGEVDVFGLLSKPSAVSVNGKSATFHFTENKVLSISVVPLSVDLQQSFTATWTL
ncbi:unnamed protein product [Owenia fusiformis]|uniref:Uncharacterized protein n=1 Tax=Owenia fusiformis TaxID=6347 RepID=A0A8J1U3P3_OWEFU|nr:unnamed protein product [Owenia fusiformis]